MLICSSSVHYMWTNVKTMDLAMTNTATVLIVFFMLNTRNCLSTIDHPLYNGNYQDDEIKDLPGFYPTPSFKQYSGYLQTS